MGGGVKGLGSGWGVFVGSGGVMWMGCGGRG